MLLDFLGAFINVFEVSDLRSSTGGVRMDLPVGVFGVLKLDGADCFLARGAGDFFSVESLRGNVKADLFLDETGLLGVEVRRSGEHFPLSGLPGVRVLSSLGSTGEVLPLIDDALLSMGETVPAREVLLGAGDGPAWAGEGPAEAGRGEGLGECECAGEGEGGSGTGSTSRRPCVTRRT